MIFSSLSIPRCICTERWIFALALPFLWKPREAFAAFKLWLFWAIFIFEWRVCQFFPTQILDFFSFLWSWTEHAVHVNLKIYGRTGHAIHAVERLPEVARGIKLIRMLTRRHFSLVFEWNFSKWTLIAGNLYFLQLFVRDVGLQMFS